MAILNDGTIFSENDGVFLGTPLVVKPTLDSLNGTHLVAQTVTSVSSLDETWHGELRVQLGN